MCIDAWNDLHSCRPLGFSGAGDIPYTAISTWADREGLDSELFRLLKHVIFRLDRDRAEREASKARAKQKGTRR